MEYQVIVRGSEVVATHPDTLAGKSSAFADAFKLFTDHREWEPKVIANEVSGTYESHTCVWPVLGETYSK